jgi:hypothetical protein
LYLPNVSIYRPNVLYRRKERGVFSNPHRAGVERVIEAHVNCIDQILVNVGLVPYVQSSQSEHADSCM